MRKRKWLSANCSRCSGHGLINAWEPTGCPECGGDGSIWVSELDRLADYPGGPLRGSAPGLYAKTKAALEAKP